MNLRLFTASDYPALVTFHNLCRPEAPTSEEELRFTDEAFGKGDVLVRHLLEHEGCVVGSSLYTTEHAGVRQFRIDLLVHPAEGLAALGNRLYAFVQEQLVLYEPTALLVRVREDWTAWRRFYETRGFVELERMWESRLNVRSFDPSPFAWAPKKAAEAGISFKTLAELPDNEQTQRLIYDTVVELLQDVPNQESLNIWPFETWQERYWQSPNRNPESYFLAFEGNMLVGMSELRKGKQAGLLATGLTGVRRPWRRQGIAQSLKLKAVAYARGSGTRQISTLNHSINRAMLSINEAMGFEKQPAWIRLKKLLTEEQS